MTYGVRWTDGAIDDLKELGPEIADRIVSKVGTYLVQDPEHLGKPLRSDKKGFFSYRFGDYRVIYSIDRGQVIITVARVGHRRDVYQ